MDRSVLYEGLRANELNDTDLPKGPQLRVALRYASLYQRLGLAGRGSPRSLRLCCAHGADCWQSAGDRRANANKGAISLPWIGREYRPGGVMVLGLNFNDGHGLALAFRLANWERAAFAQGNRKMNYDAAGYAGSMFAYCSTRSAAVAYDALRGQDRIKDRDDPRQLVEVLDHIVRLEAVKCSPRNAQNSRPTPVMLDRCPPHLLAAEITIARPRCILAFGAAASEAIQLLPNFRTTHVPEHLTVGRLTRERVDATVFALGHPARPTAWIPSHDALKRHIRRHRLEL